MESVAFYNVLNMSKKNHSKIQAKLCGRKFCRN